MRIEHRDVRLDTDWTYCGLRALVLENCLVRLCILPDVGARIYDLVFKPADHNFIWHHPRVSPQLVPYGANYDDSWCGGWDVVFPNDAPYVRDGISYPDHGELWSTAWEWQIDRTEDIPGYYLYRRGVATSTFVETRIHLEPGKPLIRFRHQITNTGRSPLDFLWKLHPAFAIVPGSRIDLPAGTVLVDEAYRDRLGPEVAEYTWPYARDQYGKLVDMRFALPSDAGVTDFQYAVGLDDGWCALTRVDLKLGFALAFPKEIFTCVWLFAAYGGWRDLMVAVLEPSTGYPYRLDEAISGGRCARLEPGESLACDVLGIVYGGLVSVSQVTKLGEVRGEG